MKKSFLLLILLIIGNISIFSQIKTKALKKERKNWSVFNKQPQIKKTSNNTYDIRFPKDQGSTQIKVDDSSPNITKVEFKNNTLLSSLHIGAISKEKEYAFIDVDIDTKKDATYLKFGFPGTKGIRQKVTFYHQVYEYIDNGSKGPSGGEFEKVKLITKEESFIVEDDAVWAVAVLVALCCIKANVGSDGWDVAFDCTCLSIGPSVPIEIEESGQPVKKFSVTKIKVEPIHGPIIASPEKFQYRATNMGSISVKNGYSTKAVKSSMR